MYIVSEANNKVLMRQHQVLISINKKTPMKNIGAWHPLRESNSQLTLRRGLLYPFN